MSTRLKERLTYANVASTLALLLVVGGGGVAVASGAVPVGSIGSPQIKNGAVKSVDIKNSTIKSSDIKNRTVKSSDIKNGTVRAADVKNGTLRGDDLADGALTGSKFADGPVGVVRAYAWMDVASGDAVLDNDYVFNSGGGPVTSNRTGTGAYIVTFSGLDVFAGQVLVTPYGSGNAVAVCKVSLWGPDYANVRCYDFAGAPVDSRFTVAFVE